MLDNINGGLYILDIDTYIVSGGVVATENLLSFLKNLSDGTRLAVIRLLVSKGETCVCEIAERLDLSQPLISHHLCYLKAAELVRDRRDGNRVYYSPDFEKLAHLCALLNEELRIGSEGWPGSSSRRG